MQLFVANVSYSAEETDLDQLFSPFGELGQIKMATDRETGRFRGFAFVTFKNSDDAVKAMKETDGTEFMGRNLIVKEAEKREPRQNNSGRDRSQSKDWNNQGQRRGGGRERRNDRYEGNYYN